MRSRNLLLEYNSGEREGRVGKGGGVGRGPGVNVRKRGGKVCGVIGMMKGSGVGWSNTEVMGRK
jgi:hypothetical protein